MIENLLYNDHREWTVIYPTITSNIYLIYMKRDRGTLFFLFNVCSGSNSENSRVKTLVKNPLHLIRHYLQNTWHDIVLLFLIKVRIFIGHKKNGK